VVPPPPEGALAADQELVLSIFNDTAFRKNPSNSIVQAYSRDCDSDGELVRGAPYLALVYPTSLILEDGSAAPEGRPGGGSGTCFVDLPISNDFSLFSEKSQLSIVQAYSLKGRRSGGASAPGVSYFAIVYPTKCDPGMMVPPPPKGFLPSVQEPVPSIYDVQ
jgi:hypothetical protein